MGEPKKKDKVLLSTLEAGKLIHRGYKTYLAHVMDKRSENQVQLPYFSIVRDFTNVFPENLPGLPLDREIQFEIELAPGTSPISKEPYRIAPVMLKELHKQLS